MARVLLGFVFFAFFLSCWLLFLMAHSYPTTECSGLNIRLLFGMLALNFGWLIVIHLTSQSTDANTQVRESLFVFLPVRSIIHALLPLLSSLFSPPHF
jgi:hypothetical protein